jgi:hypothetical protein
MMRQEKNLFEHGALPGEPFAGTMAHPTDDGFGRRGTAG